ncbi:MAG: hypothetical protein AMXMBFR64_52650 [Myxococcales bacterium]
MSSGSRGGCIARTSARYASPAPAKAIADSPITDCPPADGVITAGSAQARAACVVETADTLRVVLDPLVPFASQAVVEVLVVSATNGGAHALDQSYVFTAEDRTAPRVVSAQATARRVVQIGFDEDVLVTDPSAFAFTPLGFPAVPLAPVSAEAAGTVVTVTLHTEMTPDIAYEAAVAGVADVHFNPILGPDDRAVFTGFRPPRPAERRFDLWSMVPRYNRRADVTGDLRRFIACLQEVADLLLAEGDRFGDVFLAFELLEKADRNLAADVGIYGIISGAEPTPHAPVPDLTIDLTAPGRAYDNLGQRIFFGSGQTVDCSVDHAGIPTSLPVAGQERWLGVFLRFERLLSDPRTDGNSQQVFLRRDESFEIVVRQGAPAAIGAAVKVPLVADELLVCDVRRTNGQAQILAPDIDTSRRQAFIFAQGDAVEIVSGLWNILQPAGNTVQAALDEIDAELNDHFTGAARRHPAAHIDYPPHGFVAANTVKGALDEIVDDLSSAVAGNPGAQRVGADAVAGAPNALPAGNVDGQLSQLLAWLNAHLSAAAGAHNASAIAAAAHAYISGASVQAQLQEIVSDLQSQAAGLGAAQG